MATIESTISEYYQGLELEQGDDLSTMTRLHV